MTPRLEIMLANTGPDNIITVPYKPKEPISSLIERIQATFSTSDSSTTRKDLFLNGQRLKDHTQTMDYYRIFGRTLTYRVLSAPSEEDDIISFRVATPTGKIIHLTYWADTLVEDIKELIQITEDIVTDDQQLFYAGIQLEDNRELSFYKVIEGSTVHLSLPLQKNFTLPGILFLDNLGVSTLGERKIRFSRNASRGRVPTIGANVECECYCTPITRVICQKNLGTLEIANSHFVCPNCSNSDKIKPKTVGFLNCKVRVHRIRSIDGEQHTTEWMEVRGDDCYFLAGANIGNVTRRRLIYETISLNHRPTCTICLKVPEFFKTLPCGHRFHVGCIRKWKGVCPNCQYNRHLIFDSVRVRFKEVEGGSK
jgi:hypothetical protein